MSDTVQIVLIAVLSFIFGVCCTAGLLGLLGFI